jgi:hypothetical protein
VKLIVVLSIGFDLSLRIAIGKKYKLAQNATTLAKVKNVLAVNEPCDFNGCPLI